MSTNKNLYKYTIQNVDKSTIMKLVKIIRLDEGVNVEQDQINLVSKSGLAIQNIKHPSEAVQRAAVLQNGMAFKYIYKKGIVPSEAIQLDAVKIRGYTIQHIKNPSEAVQLAAVKRDGHAIQFIKNPAPGVIQLALKHPTLISKPDDYERLVKKYFANNTILMKKWLRYGQVMRDQ